MSYIYIASPYSHEDPTVKQARYEVALAWTTHMFSIRKFVYSPIVHCHNVALLGDLPGDFEYWNDYDTIMVGHAKKVQVLCIPGWTTSKGVTLEIGLAHKLGIPVEHIGQPLLYQHIKRYKGVTELYGTLQEF